jgi:hypothetical protein
MYTDVLFGTFLFIPGESPRWEDIKRMRKLYLVQASVYRGKLGNEIECFHCKFLAVTLTDNLPQKQGQADDDSEDQKTRKMRVRTRASRETKNGKTKSRGAK